MEEKFAEEISSKAPWWATAPIWLAAGIVGVPSLMAIGAGYYIAQHVNGELRKLDQYNLSELSMMNESLNQEKSQWTVIIKYVEEELRVQYLVCVNQSKNPAERAGCLTVQEREVKLGIAPRKK